MRTRALMLLSLFALVFVMTACTGGTRLTEEERDRRSEEQLERMSD
ncbi:MAG: hypothetical protein QNJ98_20305 [Planctomycetota bacterium]|nr:hypothetical protein [Planctomycetota bacterium]